VSYGNEAEIRVEVRFNGKTACYRDTIPGPTYMQHVVPQFMVPSINGSNAFDLGEERLIVKMKTKKNRKFRNQLSDAIAARLDEFLKK